MVSQPSAPDGPLRAVAGIYAQFGEKTPLIGIVRKSTFCLERVIRMTVRSLGAERLRGSWRLHTKSFVCCRQA